MLGEALALQSSVIKRGQVGEFDPGTESEWFTGEVRMLMDLSASAG